MPFNSGTGITDQIDMLDKLTEVVTSRYLDSVVVNAGGTGHAIGDIIEITATGSTSTIVAQLEVTSVAAGVIDGIRVYRGGAYTVDPTTTTANAQSGTSGSGISATFDLTMAAPTWVVNRRTQEAASAVFAAAGTGYTVGDTLTLVDDAGTVHDDAGGSAGAVATFTVATISGGGGTGPVATVTVATAGNYGEVPANPVTVTGGTGSGCTLTVTWQDGTKANNDHQLCFLEGEGLAGTDAIHLWIKPFTAANGFDDAFNWAIGGMTGYDATLPLQNQVGVNNTATTGQISSSDGSIQTGSDDTGSYVILKDTSSGSNMEWWINHTGRRIILVVKVIGASTTMYSSMYLGFLNQLATDTEYPYPMWVCGCTSQHNRLWSDSTELTGGLSEVISHDSASSLSEAYGPGYVRTPAGTWVSHNMWSSVNSNDRDNLLQYGIWPIMEWAAVALGNAAPPANGGPEMIDTSNFYGLVPSFGVPGAPNFQVKPTPGTGDDYYKLFNLIPFYRDSTDMATSQAYGEVDSVFLFFTGNNAVVSEDRFVLGTKRYSIFQNGNRTQVWSYFALDED